MSNKFFCFLRATEYFIRPVTILKQYNTHFAFIVLEPSWLQACEFRHEYVTEEMGMCFQFDGDPKLYIEINALIDNWDILTDRNPASEDLFVHLLSFYRFNDQSQLPTAITRRPLVNGVYLV